MPFIENIPLPVEQSAPPTLENLEVPPINIISEPENIIPPTTEPTSFNSLSKKVLELSNFDLGDGFKDQQVEDVQLMISFASKTVSTGELEIDYFYQGAWQNA